MKKRSTRSGGRYARVRALSRGLDVLVELGRRGRAKPAELALATGIDRTTVYRVLDTLAAKGFVAASPSDSSFGLTPAVRQLSEGFTELDGILRVVAPELGRLFPKVLWPTDFASFEQGAMVIRETTHRFSPFSVHRSMIGRTRPVVRSALGRAVLAAVSAEEREAMLNIIARSSQPDAKEAADTRYVEALVEDTRARGYAWSIGGAEKHISAIALPVRGYQRVLGAINLIFFRSAMTPEEAAARYLQPLRETVDAIEQQFVND